MENETEKTSWRGNPHPSLNRLQFWFPHFLFKRPHSKILVSEGYENVLKSGNQQTRNNFSISVGRKIIRTSKLLFRIPTFWLLTWLKEPKKRRSKLFCFPILTNPCWLYRWTNLLLEHGWYFHSSVDWAQQQNKCNDLELKWFIIFNI